MNKVPTAMFTLLLMMFVVGCASNENTGVENEESIEQDTDQETSETDYDYEGEGGYLWKVNNGDTIMYLQGTIHLGHEDFYPLATEIEEAYESSDVVLPEINMLEAEVNEEEITEMALYEDETTLNDVLSEDSYAKLSDIFEENDMTLEDYNKFQPWFIERILGELSNEKSELSPEYGVDLYFLQRSLEDNKEIVELETIESQYDVLSGYSMETQVQMLEGSVEAFAESGTALNELGHDWIQGETESIVEQFSEGLGSFDDEYQQEMNDTRNDDMSNKLDEILRTNDGQTYFVIVGSAHFVIEPSVLSLLEEKGYEVEKIY